MTESWNYMDTDIEVSRGDITDAKVDALVNAANTHLRMGSGVGGSIKSKGGKIIEDMAIKAGPIQGGDAVVTTAGALKAKCIIHAVTMGADSVASPDKVRRATISAFKRADEKHLRSIAFPALGTGVGAVPFRESARVMVDALMEYLAKGSGLQRVLFVMFSDEAYAAFTEELRARIR